MSRVLFIARYVVGGVSIVRLLKDVLARKCWLAFHKNADV